MKQVVKRKSEVAAILLDAEDFAEEDNTMVRVIMKKII